MYIIISINILAHTYFTLSSWHWWDISGNGEWGKLGTKPEEFTQFMFTCEVLVRHWLVFILGLFLIASCSFNNGQMRLSVISELYEPSRIPPTICTRLAPRHHPKGSSGFREKAVENIKELIYVVFAIN